MKKVYLSILAITIGLVWIMVVEANLLIQDYVDKQVQAKADMIAAQITHEKIETLGHKYVNYLLSQNIMFQKKDEVIKGNGKPQYMVKSNQYVEKMMVLETTAYWTHDPIDAWGEGIAADGTAAVAYKTCAVDPRVIPLGSEVYIPTIGWLRCNDTGNAIKGHILDIAMPSREHAWDWGRRYVYAKVRIKK